ncbi:hypothetical protein NF673_13300 [Pseudomonas moraviensis]|uniref:hypothetical protein n=1 Tax=Pseudomonas moraviensis TaxID=321662 RepID=UPI002093A93A|nr:hypothetical protein [Pseudomonas moraviensis]UST61629.1 hypothetical protein NF673_13300 [Pseudomonas moraviensis]
MTTFSDDQLLNLTPEQLNQLTPAQVARRKDLLNKPADQRVIAKHTITEKTIKPVSSTSGE